MYEWGNCAQWVAALGTIFIGLAGQQIAREVGKESAETARTTAAFAEFSAATRSQEEYNRVSSTRSFIAGNHCLVLLVDEQKHEKSSAPWWIKHTSLPDNFFSSSLFSNYFRSQNAEVRLKLCLQTIIPWDADTEYFEKDMNGVIVKSKFRTVFFAEFQNNTSLYWNSVNRALSAWQPHPILAPGFPTTVRNVQRPLVGRFDYHDTLDKEFIQMCNDGNSDKEFLKIIRNLAGSDEIRRVVTGGLSHYIRFLDHCHLKA